MEENKFVTKAKISQGIKFTEEVVTDEGTWQIRQLKYGEKGKADSIMTRGLLGKASLAGKSLESMEGPGSNMVSNMYDYNAYIISCALSLDEEGAEVWTPEDVKNSVISDASIDTLVGAIEKSNGMGRGGAREIIQPFCKDKGGNENSKSDSVGADSVSPKSGNADQPTS